MLHFLRFKFELRIATFSTVLGVDFHPAAKSEEDLLRGQAWVVLIISLLILTRLDKNGLEFNQMNSLTYQIFLPVPVSREITFPI